MPTDRARLYHEVMTGYVARGVAPHYVEVALRLGWEPARARTVLHEVTELGLPLWLHPGTDLVASFSPFSSLPTLYRLSIDGAAHGYAQCGLEVLAVSWLFPGCQVRADSLCPDCSEPLSLSIRDGEILSLDPPTIVGHINIPVPKWRGQYPLA